ncbi:chloride channel protein [Leptolyngbya sp. 'hensonii']|nr:chloride channel protein [Leptolyngbya sp. 'hensonii']
MSMPLASFLSSSLQRLLRPKSLAIFEACLIGLISALAAVLLKQSIAWLENWQGSISGPLPIWLALPLMGILGGLLSGILIERLAPEASGSGIPQVKAALAYVPIALDLRVALVKLVSTTLALGSGLSLGRQGPTVQIGAALAAQSSRWIAPSPTYQRQLVAAGAAAGLAAGFNAPIAGVLFVIEELLQDLSDLTLGTAILAAFVGGVVSRLLGGRGLIPELNGIDTSFSLQEIPFLLILGAIAGVLGGLFCQGILASLAFYRNWFRPWALSWRMALAGGVTGIVLALLPPILRSSTESQDFLVVGNTTWQMVAIAFLARCFLILVAYGSGAPGGLFAPSLLLGSALGGLMEIAVQGFQHISGAHFFISSPTIYALTGMGAFFSAVTRGPITAIVIVFEMTADFNVVLPLMIGSVASYLVAERLFQGSIYKHLLELRGIHLEQKAPADQRWQTLTAADIMQRRVETLSSQMTIEEARQAFARSHHRGFPVVEAGKLVGILSQSDLGKAVQRQMAGHLPLSLIMSHRLVTVGPTDSLAHVLYLLNHYQVSRLPVTEGRKLIGIITRADIIRAESDQVSGETNPLGPKPEPSYVVYQTQAPATGQGRLLVPLSNPETADALLRLAATIAKQRHYELECLQVVLVPRHKAPSETPVDITASRYLMDHAVQQGQTWKIPVHTQVRVAHDVAQAVLETIKERHIDLLLMGWKGSTTTPGRIFGNAVDTAIRQAACDVILVKLSDRLKLHLPAGELLTRESAYDALLRLVTLNRWLVPTAGGPNAQYAITLMPALTSLSRKAEVRLCQVFPPSETAYDISTLETNAQFLRQQLASPVITIPLCAKSVSDAVIDMAQKDQCDVIVLGASREGLLQQVIQGNIPEAISHHCDCTVILVRKALA